MRKLETRDVFAFSRLIKQGHLKEELKTLFSQYSESQDELEVGLNLLLSLIELFAEKEAEQLFYEFLSGPLESSAEEVSMMGLFDLIEQVKEVAEWDKWRHFLTSAIR